MNNKQLFSSTSQCGMERTVVLSYEARAHTLTSTSCVLHMDKLLQASFQIFWENLQSSDVFLDLRWSIGMAFATSTCGSTIFAIFFLKAGGFLIREESSQVRPDSSDITTHHCVVQSAWALLISLNSLEAIKVCLFIESIHPQVKKTRRLWGVVLEYY